MTLNDILEKCWRYLGFHQSGQRQDFMKQTIIDSANETLSEIVQSLTYPEFHVQEYTLALTANTSIYTLDDMCYRVLSAYTKDTAAHQIIWLPPSEADRSGLRNTAAANTSMGPYTATNYPVTQTASKTGYCTIAEAGTSVTYTSGTNFAAADTGRRIRLNGDDTDYIFTYVSSTSGTIDRPYRSRITGQGTTGVGSGLTAGLFEIGPPGTLRMEIVPAWGAYTQTLYYRGQRKHHKLANATDVPDIQEEWHNMLLYGTFVRLSLFKEDGQMVQMYNQLYQSELQRYAETDRPIISTPIANRIAALAPPRRCYARNMPYDPSIQFRAKPYQGY